MNIFKIKINDWSSIVNNLKKIIVVIILYAIIWVAIIFNFCVEYSENFFDKDKKPIKTIGLSVLASLMGENLLADRLLIAANKLGGRSYVIKYPIIMNSVPIFNFPMILTE
jgi:hypothetical protein